MSAIDELVWLLDEAFAGRGIEATGEAQSLLANLATVGGDAWRALPPGGARTIESIALHVGTCKRMYDAYAFGPGTLRWDDPDLSPWPAGGAPMPAAIAWLREVHGELVAHVRSLSDDDLDRSRPTNWGDEAPTRWLLSTLLQHDTYHAGEINHVRSLLAADDGWRWG